MLSQELNIALISSGSALAGVVVSQLITLLQAHLANKQERKVLLRQKYERVAEYLSESIHWYQGLSACTSLNQLHASPPSPSVRLALVLSFLYFPELKQPLAAYSNGMIELYNSVICAYDPYNPGSAGAQALQNQQHLALVKKFILLRQECDNSIEKYANKYT